MTNAQATTLTELEDGARAAGRTLSTTFDGSALIVEGFTGGHYRIGRNGEPNFIPTPAIDDLSAQLTPSTEEPRMTITPAITPATAAADEALRVEHGIRTKRDANGKVRGYDVRGEHIAKRADAIEKAAYWVAYEAEVAAAIAAEKAKIERKERKRTSKRAARAAAADEGSPVIAAMAGDLEPGPADLTARINAAITPKRTRKPRTAPAAPAKLPRTLTKRERERMNPDEKYAAALVHLADAGAEPTIARLTRITGLTPSSVRRAIKRAARVSG